MAIKETFSINFFDEETVNFEIKLKGNSHKLKMKDTSGKVFFKTTETTIGDIRLIINSIHNGERNFRVALEHGKWMLYLPNHLSPLVYRRALGDTTIIRKQFPEINKNYFAAN